MRGFPASGSIRSRLRIRSSSPHRHPRRPNRSRALLHLPAPGRPRLCQLRSGPRRLPDRVSRRLSRPPLPCLEPAPRVVPKFRAAQPGIQLPRARQAAPSLYEPTSSSVAASTTQNPGGDTSPQRTRDFAPDSPSSPRPAPNHQPPAPARPVAMPLAPRERAPLTALPPTAESKAPPGPVIRIGSVEVHITPPVPPAAVAARPAAAAAPAAPLSREMISLFGLRQG